MTDIYSSILSDIKTKMEAVTDIGKVYDYYRWNNNPSTFISLFAYTPSGGGKHIRGWEITRVQVPEHKAGAYFRHHKFKIAGYLALKDVDATDKTFQVLIDKICEKFRTADPPSGATWYYMNGDNPGDSPCQVDIIEARMFGDVLCHYAEISLSITERISP